MAADFFTIPWWEGFILAWNRSSYVRDLAGLGVVEFVALEDGSKRVIILNWDENGRLTRATDNRLVGSQIFEADIGIWRDFIAGKRKASQAVLDGWITYSGNIETILPYSEKFNSVAKVAQSLSKRVFGI